MDWSKGFSASYYMAIIDKRTWNDASRREITGGSISRSGSGLRQSADIDCPGYEPGTEQWIRVWLDVRQNGAAEHVAVFTGLACSPSIKRDGNIKEIPLECYSVLKPADDVMLQRGWYIAAGMNGAQMAASMLQEVIPAPVIVEGSSPALQQAIIAEDGETVLSMERLDDLLKEEERGAALDSSDLEWILEDELTVLLAEYQPHITKEDLEWIKERASAYEEDFRTRFSMDDETLESFRKYTEESGGYVDRAAVKEYVGNMAKK